MNQSQIKQSEKPSQIVLLLKFFILICMNTFMLAYANSLLSLKLSVNLYAEYSFVISNAGLIAIFLTIGYDVSTNKYFANYLKNQNYDLAKGFLVTIIKKIILASILLLILTFLYWYFEPVLERTLEPLLKIDMPEEEIITSLNVAIFIAALSVTSVILRCLATPILGYIIGVFVPTLLVLIVAMILPYHNDSEADFNLIIRSYAFAYLIISIISIIIIMYYAKNKLTNNVARYEEAWQSSSRVMMYYSIVAMLGMVIPIDVLQFYLGSSVSKNNIATFSFAFTILYAVCAIPQMCTRFIVNAQLFFLHNSGQKSVLEQLIVKTNRASLGFNCGIILLLIIFHNYLLSLINNKLENLLTVGSILAAAYVLDLSITSTRNALLMLGNEKKATKNRIITISLQLILSLISGYYWGLFGVCWTIVIIRNLSAGLMLYELKKAGYRSF